MRDVRFIRARRWRSSLFLLAGLTVLVSVVTGAALAGNGGDKTPPGQATTAVTSADGARPAHPAHPAHPVTPATTTTHPVEPAHPAKPAHPATTTHPGPPVTPTSPGKSAAAQHHVIICHRTGSATNPYVVINVSIRAWQHGHQTHPALDGRNDILLQDPATPGEKLPVSRCTTAATTPATTPANTPAVPPAAPTGPVVVDATKPGVQNAPGTATVGTPVVIVVNTRPNTAVTVAGAGVKNAAGVLGATKTISGKRGVARVEVVPTKQGVFSVRVGNHVVKRFGVLGASTSGKSLTG